MDLLEILKQMTLTEKAELCSGADFWRTQQIERLGIASVMVTDGPHGLRKQPDSADHLGISESIPATCFPTASATGCSFDRDLMFTIGAAIGEEALQEKVSVVLGPGVNIKRSPLCGRNFEYISEDPLLSGELAAALIKGIQSKNIGTSLKHFACNNQEKARMINDSIVDERALREIYLTAFEIAVKKAQPWTIMCSYNKINGIYACENKNLLSDIARDEWGFKGAMITDWGAMNDRVQSLKAGMDLEMPFAGPYHDMEIAAAVKSGELDEAVLDQSVLRILELISRTEQNPSVPYDQKAHDLLARKAVCESAVLLKNDNLLPARTDCSIAVIGEFARAPRFQGGGSSKINPNQVTSAIEELTASAISHQFAPGYDLSGTADSGRLTSEAVAAARGKDIVLIYAGLPDEYESEGYDRDNLEMPPEQNALITQLAAINPNTVVLLHTGSPVSMPWLDQVKAVLLLGLGGQNTGGASVDLIFGRVNPSGKLAETYPLNLEDTPASRHFGQRITTEYRESIYVGYRYYDKAEKAVLFPFGFGLSYTSFEYHDLKLSSDRIKDTETLTVSLKVKNTGSRAGREIVQIYVAPPASCLYKAESELRAFEKISLEAGEEKEITFELSKRAFAYWNVNLHDWHVEIGIYQIRAGSSSRDIHCQADVEMVSTADDAIIPDYRVIAPDYYNLQQKALDIPAEQFEAVYGSVISPAAVDPRHSFNLNSTAWDIRKTVLGKIMIRLARRNIKAMLGGKDPKDDHMVRMVDAMLYDMPIRSVSMGGLPLTLLNGFVMILNRQYLKGLHVILKRSNLSYLFKLLACCR